MTCPTAQANWFNLIAVPVHFLNPAVNHRQGLCGGWVGEEPIVFSGQERFLGDSLEVACTHTADNKLSSEDIGTESTDRCTELHSISCIGPEI